MGYAHYTLIVLVFQSCYYNTHDAASDVYVS